MLAIEKCLAMSEKIYQAVRACIRPGISEEEIKAVFLEAAYSGPFPVTAHEYNLMAGRRTEQIGLKEDGGVVGPGDPVLFDLLVQVEGYWSDTTRVFFCGPPPQALADAYQAVRRVLARTEAFVQPGVPARDIWRFVRDAVAEEGYEGLFPHHAGHVIGREVVESDFIAENNTPVEAGAFLALEPGIYLPGVGGVRLENNYVLTKAGLLTLFHYPLEMSHAVIGNLQREKG